MRLLNAPESLFVPARNYLAIYSAGVVFMALYNAATAVFTGLGDSRRPLYFLLMSSVLNVVLDILAVGPLQMGGRGRPGPPPSPREWRPYSPAFW